MWIGAKAARGLGGYGKRKLGVKMAGFADWRKKAGGMCEKAMQAAATVYLLVAACMVPLYMHDGYYGLGTAKFQLYRNVGFMALPLMVIFAAAKAAGGCKGGRRRLWGREKAEWDAAGHLD
ncbi:MAG: hypothetical protein ACLVLH_18160 [Eisenbergiella massiliensis]